MPYFEEGVIDPVDFKDYEYRADDGAILEALIKSFEDSSYDDLADVLRVVNRAFRIKTTDLVGNDNMIGARVTFVDTDGDAHRAIVIEPEVASMGANEAYDPNRDEMVDPSNYPLGTVQLIYGHGGDFGTDDYFFDRLTSDTDGRGLEVATSVTPARSPDDTYAYFAGWDYADERRDD